jgi:hypothetical protein
MVPASTGTPQKGRKQKTKMHQSKKITENNRRKGTDKQRARYPRCAIRDKGGDRRLKRLEMNR